MSKNMHFRPLVDKLYLWISIPTLALLTGYTAISAIHPLMLAIAIPIDLFVLYFLISSLFGYVELRESSVFIKFGFLMKKEIQYEKIKGVTRERKFYSDSMLSLKNSLEHLNIKYNTFDMATISVVGNDDFIKELEARIQNIK